MTMNDTIQRIDFTQPGKPPSRHTILTTADWIGQQDRDLDFSQAVGFVILRRYDHPLPAAYGVHRLITAPEWWRRYNADSEDYLSNWAHLVSSNGATMFQELLIERGFAPKAWQDLDLDAKHRVFKSNILPVEWKRPSVSSNEFLNDRVWLYRKEA